MNKMKGVLLSLFAAVPLAAAFNAQAGCEHGGPLFPPVSILSTPDTYSYSQERVRKLLAEMEKSSLGRDIAKLREKYGSKIALVSPAALKAIAGDPLQDDKMFYVGTVMGRTLALNGDGVADKDLFITIAHESRHVWQNKTVMVNLETLDPLQGMILNRYKEADAFAFEMYFAYLYEKETGIVLISPPENNMTPYESTYALFKLNMDSGIPIETSYRSLLHHTLALVHENGYDEAFLDRQENGWQCHADSKTAQIRTGIQYRLKEEDYANLLRRMVTVGFDGQKPLTENTYADLTDWEKIGGITPENLERLKKLQAIYAAAAIAPSAARPSGPQL